MNFTECFIAACNYCDEQLEGIGSLKGKNCTIIDIKESEEETIITFNWYEESGEPKQEHVHIRNGKNPSQIELLKKIYPVGSVYINTVDVNPLLIFGFGKWERIANNMTLWGATKDAEVNNIKTAGLPDITGKLTNQYLIAKRNGSDTVGCIDGVANKNTGNYGVNYSSDEWGTGLNFKASKGETKLDGTLKNDVYGKSNTVQPPAFVVNIWRRFE